VIVFAVGFAFLGVGSGGLDLASLVQSVFGAGSSGTSVSKALGKVHKHPNDAGAWKALADAYGSKGRTADQVKALERYVKLAPKCIERSGRCRSWRASSRAGRPTTTSRPRQHSSARTA